MKGINTNNAVEVTAIELYKEFQEKSISVIDLVLNYIPMYQGDLNPTWKYWNDVKEKINEFSKNDFKEVLETNQTERGFSFQDFEDSNGILCSIQKSSAAMEDKIWLGANKIGLKKFVPNKGGWENVELEDRIGGISHVANNRMHLNQETVLKILPTLLKFATTGDI